MHNLRARLAVAAALAAVAPIVHAAAQTYITPFEPVVRDRVLTICELGREASAMGDTASAQKIINTMRETTSRPDAASDLCEDYIHSYIDNPRNAQYLRIKKKAEQALAKNKANGATPR